MPPVYDPRALLPSAPADARRGPWTACCSGAPGAPGRSEQVEAAAQHAVDPPGAVAAHAVADERRRLVLVPAHDGRPRGGYERRRGGRRIVAGEAGPRRDQDLG